jgi:hypothetical protein
MDSNVLVLVPHCALTLVVVFQMRIFFLIFLLWIQDLRSHILQEYLQIINLVNSHQLVQLKYVLHDEITRFCSFTNNSAHGKPLCLTDYGSSHLEIGQIYLSSQVQ